MLNKITGVILAGGKSSRFGSNKALARLDGVRLIEHPAGILQSIFKHRLLVTNTPDEFAFLGWPMTEDFFPDAGPLAGIHAALQQSITSRIFVTACDMPHLQPSLIRFLCDIPTDWDVVLPWTARGPEPLCAVYNQRALSTVETALNAGKRRVQDILPALQIRRVEQKELDPMTDKQNPFANINRPADLAIIQKHASQEQEK